MAIIKGENVDYPSCMEMTEDYISRKQYLLLAIRAALVLNEEAALKKFVLEYEKL